MVEQDAIGYVHIVGFTMVDDSPIAVQFGTGYQHTHENIQTITNRIVQSKTIRRGFSHKTSGPMTKIRMNFFVFTSRLLVAHTVQRGGAERSARHGQHEHESDTTD